jgi:hypothetical protein
LSDESLYGGFTYADGNGNCHRHCYGNANAYLDPTTEDYAHTAAASYSASSAVSSLGLRAAFFGNSRAKLASSRKVISCLSYSASNQRFGRPRRHRLMVRTASSGADSSTMPWEKVLTRF